MASATTGPSPELETVLTSFDTAFTWSYAGVKEGLEELYTKAKQSQWDSAELLDWRSDVDPESEIVPRWASQLATFEPVTRLSAKERAHLAHAELALTLSNFLHGEQGAMIVASQLVSQVPWMDAKLYASTQTMDEARHVEVFHRYVHDKLEWEWPINADLKILLDTLVADGRWDVKYLGMQVILEGVAMGAFGTFHQITSEPLLKSLLFNVMRDESRHVAFGVRSLRGFYDDLEACEKRQREDFVIWACEMLRNRFVLCEVADVMGWKRDELREAMLQSPTSQAARSVLFSRVVPNLKRLGLLTPHVREGLGRLDLLRFENMDPELQEKTLGIA